MRKFSLIAIDPPKDRPDRQVPARLLELVGVLGSQYAATSAVPDAARDEALNRGDACIDLSYESPLQARGAADALLQMLDEADEYCRRGQSLLTLAAPADAVVFRRWWLGEFVRQMDGLPPTPWPGSLD